ncbi:MAG: glutamate synthase large subunit [Planctomycetota bacterium]|jgi:glutamate synthase (NADPH/NADH) large chain|nr:glutamate synthase large subunit [Planctomycetota bacterium]
MIDRPGLPPARGMYDPANEHDACGVGFIADIKGRKSHSIVQRGVAILENLTHRGAVGADPLDGDGAGIMIQTPDAFCRAVAPGELPALGDYATGLVFLPTDSAARAACEQALDGALKRTGLQPLGWRDVPTDSSAIGRDARASEPTVRQVFVGRGDVDAEKFNLMLYLGRKRAEAQVIKNKLNKGEYFYVNSLSPDTMLYKGMLLSDQLPVYYADLADERVVSAIAFVHQRYSTNTFPTWDLAQPFRFCAHNGEINTLRGNINRMKARTALFEHPWIKDIAKEIDPVVIEGGSDTACFDNALEMLTLTGRPLSHALAMMVPEAWATKSNIDPDLKAFYEYHACLMEPWDGPANMVSCDGTRVVAVLDRNGLRPARFWITDDDEIIYASEAGVLEVPPEKIVRKDRLAPGKMIMVDTERGLFLDDEEIKADLLKIAPWRNWVDDNLVRFNELPAPAVRAMPNIAGLRQQQSSHGYTLEELRILVAPMARDGQEPVGSMGTDTPMAVMSERPKNLFWYFKQLFAQVTNPAIDPLRETVVMSLTSYLGRARNIIETSPKHCRLLELEQPILSNQELEQIRSAELLEFSSVTVPTLFPAEPGVGALEKGLSELCAAAEKAVDDGHTVVILSDRDISTERAPIPSLLALSSVHHHLIRAGKRTQCSLIVESGEPREVHHFALLLGYGAAAVNPYLAFESIEDMLDQGMLPRADGNARDAEGGDEVAGYLYNYIKAVGKGLFKVFSKMGISTLQSYSGAQVFEAIGLSKELVNRCFTGTATRIEGAGLAEIAEETLRRHRDAFAKHPEPDRDLERGGEYHWRREGEEHLMTPEVIATLQKAVRNGDYKEFKAFTKLVDGQSKKLCTVRGLFTFKGGTKAIPLDEVEPVEAITRRFCTGAMSLGSISTEAHETMAMAMNRLGGKSNTGEGGEDQRRFTKDDNGDWRRSKIKQVASGRFGVTPHYLVNADEIQIKVAQGAKPGEGGQLPGHKVSEYIGSLRYSVPGVTLISPPPHHDIYSIEDLAQLIFDLKNCNPEAEISVKLVSEVGVGTVAAGVSKGKAERVVIAGFDGGTGASPMSSIKHAGLPWELGLAETQQTLVRNDLRTRIYVQTDGQLRSARDVIIAAMLGADEYGFATVALMTMGCIMMRKCHLNTCPVGIATQDEALRERFDGKVENVVNYFTFLAEEVRETMAELGMRSLDELIGRTDMLEMDEAVRHWKCRGVDLSALLHQEPPKDGNPVRRITGQDHDIYEILDRKLIEQAKPALEKREKVSITTDIHNYNRTALAMLSGEVAKRHGRDGLPDGTINITMTGIAGQSFGAFLASGINVTLLGEGNDYVGKGMSGGRIVVRPDAKSPFVWSENSVVGNTLLYGATGGEFFAAGRAGERFCVRNSGVTAVIEGVGDHGCEYMTGGTVVCLGKTGRNFAAGMSGGFAYILDEDRNFTRRCNMAMVEVEKVCEDDEWAKLHTLISRHQQYTESPRAAEILADWDNVKQKFVRVFPHEFRRVLNERARRNKEEVVHG